MKNKSWSCSVTRTCLKNTVIDPVAVQERSLSAKATSLTGTTQQAQAMATPAIDHSVTNKEDVDALNTLILRKLAKESFMNEGGSRKVGYSGESHCNKKASTWGTIHEATVSCKCGSNVGNELFSPFHNLHNNTTYMDTTKSNSGSFDGGKFSEGVGSIMSRIGLDNKKKSEPELPVFQNSCRFDKVPQPKSLISTSQDFLKSIPSKDASEWQGTITVGHNSTKESLSISTEQASNVKDSMHTVGQMWCIPEVNSVGDVKGTESSPSHRCSIMGVYEKSTDSRNNPASPLAVLDEHSPLENDLLKPHVNSPVHEEDSLKEVIEQTSLHNAIIKNMQLRIDEADWNLERSKQFNDSPPAKTELFRKIFRDEGVEVVSSKASWPKQLKTAAYVRCNLRELMQREELEDDIDGNINALRTSYVPSKPGSKGLSCLEELARSLVRKQFDTKEENSLGDHGTPTRLESDIAKVKYEEASVHDVGQEDTKTEPNTTPRNQLIAESTIQGAQEQKGRNARMASPRQNHVHSSCLGESCKNVDGKEENDQLMQGKASLLETGESVVPNDFCNDSAPVCELEMDWGTDRDDLEVLLQFLTMKQQLRENKKADVEVVVQTEAIVRELLARMKQVSNRSSSVDSDASICYFPKSHAQEPVMDDGYGERRRNEQIRRLNTNNATMRTLLARLTFEDSVDPHGVTVHPNQNIDCQNRPAIRRPPFVVPSSSKSQPFQPMAGSTSTRKTTSCVRSYINQSEESKVAKSPSTSLDEARKRSRCSPVSERQPKSCRTIQSIVENTIDAGSEEVNSVGSYSNVVEGGPLTITGTEKVDGTSGAIQVVGSIELGGIPNETGDAIPLVSARNLANRASSAPAMTPWNYQREKQLPIAHNLQIASPNKRSIPSSPTSPDNRKQCRDSPTRRSSPNNRPSPLSSPQRQQKPRPATTTSKSTAAQLRSPKRPSPLSSSQRQQYLLSSPQRQQKPLSSPQRQQKPRPAIGTLISTVDHVGSPKPSKTLSKEEADHMMSPTIISKPGSHDPEIFPAGISKAVVQESIAMAKDSSDPYVDFRDSMLEMMQEKNLWQRQEELQDLLQCFLHLNQPVHHQLIHQAFSDVVSCGSPANYLHKGSRKERPNAHFSRRSSPSRQLYYGASQPSKSPVRGGW